MAKRVLLVGAIVLVLAAAAGEGLLRLQGRRPWVFLGRAVEEAGVPVLHEPDPQLGWISKPGHYSYPLGFLTRQPDAGWLELEIWPDRSRATAPAPPEPGRPRIVFVGCSFTFGWAIPDDETLAWRVSDALEGVDVTNLGTGGYGSYQSLLRMERYLDEGEGPVPELVVYGLAGGHGLRDAATYAWQRMLSGKGTEPVPLPRASVDEAGELVRHPPEPYPVWPGSESSALVAWLQDRWARVRAAGRAEEADAVQLAVVREMHRSFAERGTRLLVAVLALGPDQVDPTFAFFEREGIDFVSLLHPDYGKPEYRVPVDGHPNGAMNALWAERLVPALRERL